MRRRILPWMVALGLALGVIWGTRATLPGYAAVNTPGVQAGVIWGS